jgi:hypothetical protein
MSGLPAASPVTSVSASITKPVSLHNAHGFFSYSTVCSLVIVTVKAEGGSLATRAGEIKAGAADLQPAHGAGDDDMTAPQPQ